MQLHTLPTRLGRGAVAGLLVVTFASVAHAQADRFSARLLAGASSPTGELKDYYNPGGLVGLQASFRLNDYVGVATTTTWANAPTFRGTVPTSGIGWTLDGGVEVRSPRLAADVGSSWRLQPFVGGGLGTRAYMEARYYGSSTGLAGYGAVGADLNRNESWLGLRLEARGYQTSFTDVQQEKPRKNGSAMDILLGVRLR